MARSTCNPNIEVPKGMLRFEVINTTIKDSIGQYCVAGDYAVLTEEHAAAYLENNNIRVALPDFGEVNEDADPDGSDEDEDPDGSDDGAGEDSAKRSETKAPSGSGSTKGRKRAKPDS